MAATAMLLTSFVGTATNIAVPVLEEAFPDASLATISWVVSGFNVTQVTLMLLGGRLADRLGRRRLFLAGMIVFAVGAFLSGIAPSVELIIAARILQAVGVAMVLPASLAAVLPLFPISRHATVVSTWSSMGILGAAAAPTVAALLLEVSSWRLVFLAVVPVALLAWFAGIRTLPAAVPSTEPPPLDLLGTFSGTIAVGGLAMVIVQGRVWGWTDPLITALMAATVSSALLFVQQSLTHAEPLLDFGLLRIRSFSVVTVASALLATSTAATWFLYPLFMVQIWDYTIFQVGLAMTPGPLAVVVVTLFAGRFADRRGYRGLLILGSILPCIGTVWMAWRLSTEANYVVDFLPGTTMIGLGMGLVLGPANSAALRDVPEVSLGAANAAYNTLRFLGTALGVAVGAAIIGDVVGVDRLERFVLTWWVMVGVMSLAPVVLVVAYPRRQP
ncbi:MAG: MFS transporter [Actinomycetia bacterium]|nr:MFS transporter [Actinomycetes bacterium]